MKLLTLFFLFVSYFVFGQTNFPIDIQGKVFQINDSLPLAYVKVFNKSTKKGVITNQNGNFKLSIKSWNDTLVIAQVGFKTIQLKVIENQSFYAVEMAENVQLMDEVKVSFENNQHLYKLIQDCKKNKFFKPVQAKAYYELKSYMDTTQVELVESYFNAELYGYNLNSLKLKAGRLAILPKNNRVFISQSSSKTFKMMELVNDQSYFPKTALDLSPKESKKEFRLFLNHKYLDEKNDSIYLISYFPREKNDQLFRGRIWLNVTDHTVEKIEMESDNCGIYPFATLFKTDSIENVSMQITKTLQAINGKMCFNHVDFSYEVFYHSRVNKEEAKRYSVKTNAVLYAYDFGESFHLPNYDLKESLSDYRIISAMPYNSFFWKYNDEYKMSDDNASNENFFKDLNVLTNVELFGSKATKWVNNPRAKEKYWRLSQTSFFEHPYVHWSTNRILLRKILGDTTQLGMTEDKGKMYNLSVKIFSDYNQYQDSIHILSVTMIDPYETFCNYPLDRNINCFVNMYFDLTEMERKKWELNYKKRNLTYAEYMASYVTLSNNIGYKQMKFLKNVERGNDLVRMKYWNTEIIKSLGIDNMELFGLKE